MGRDLCSPTAPFPLLTTLFWEERSPNADRAIPNNCDLDKIGWPWHTAPTLAYEAKGESPRRTPKPVQRLGRRSFSPDGDQRASYKAGLRGLLNPARAGPLSRAGVIVSSGNLSVYTGP